MARLRVGLRLFWSENPTMAQLRVGLGFLWSENPTIVRHRMGLGLLWSENSTMAGLRLGLAFVLVGKPDYGAASRGSTPPYHRYTELTPPNTKRCLFLLKRGNL